ncbi:development-specific protein LVN1.2-like [Lytechinus pictus]|uniref:development-specific protein LVN1.2-like n=1 Tax=Lytechinus pictus TaxID=7653 RepID=UPI0030B9F2D0
MKALLISSFLACVVIASAQRPIPCCAPDQFAFHYEQVLSSQVGDNPMAILEESLDAAYDFVQALVGMEAAIRPVGEPETKLKIIQNFTAGYQWTVNGEKCTKQSLQGVIPPSRCVPDDATFEGTFAVGLEKLKVHTWLIGSSPGVIKGMQRYTVTDYMCTPFSSSFIGTDSTTEPPAIFVNAGNYMNFTNKITDPDRWFKLPSSCNSTAPEVSSDEGLSKFATARPVWFF